MRCLSCRIASLMMEGYNIRTQPLATSHLDFSETEEFSQGSGIFSRLILKD